MSFFDVFNLSFVVYLGILILCLSLLFVYFESKLREQNHKLTHMLGIVTALANQPQERSHEPTFYQQSDYTVPSFGQVRKVNDLIQVSDGEDEDDDDQNEIEDLEDDAEEEEEEEEEEEDEAEEVEDEEEGDEAEDIDDNISDLEDLDEHQDEGDKENLESVKVLKLDFLSPTIKENDLFESEETDVIDDIHLGDDNQSIHSIDSNGEKDYEIKQEAKSVADLSETESESINSSKDLKKMSMNKLKKMALEKGLLADSSKMKKHEIISLLEKIV